MAALTPGYVSFEQFDTEGPCSDAKFKAKANLKEGVSGQYPIDDTFENTDYELLWGECDCPMK